MRLKQFLARGLAWGGTLVALSAVFSLYIVYVRYGWSGVWTMLHRLRDDGFFWSKLFPIELAFGFVGVLAYEMAKAADRRIKTWLAGRSR
jgi:hypothetical protein